MTFLQEFKQFAVKGNALDLAVGVVIGAAFGKIVTSLTDYILMPLIGIIAGGNNVDALAVTIGDSVFAYGKFLTAVLDFILIALVLFLFIKSVNRMIRREEQKAESKPENIKLLEEIRDALKKSN